MAETEEYFPRGGKKPTVKYFKQSSNFLGSAEQGEKKKKRPKKKSEADDGYLSDEAAREVDQSYKNCAIGLSYKTIKPGVLILGRVRQVQETRLNVMLPCKMMGTVMACHVSEPYNKLLEAYVNDQVESIPELPDMFRPGQYVAMKVLEVDGHKLMLSMMSQHVNGGKVLADLHNGCLLQAAVSSVEDHGYVMDIGIPDTRAFLPKSNANPELELVPGLLTWVSVKSTSNSVVTLSNQLAALQAGVLRRSPNAGILPASAVDFHVDKPLDNGIEGHIFSDTTAYVQRQHADTVKGKKPALGQRVRARVLYMMPTVNTPFLTLKNIFNTTHPDLEGEQKYQEGDIIDDAQVIKITGRSIHFSLGGCVGTLSLKRVAVHEDLTDEQLLASSYPIGSKHKVRVLCYNLMDYSYTVSDQPGVLTERYFSWGQLKPGQVVDATIRTVDTSVTLTVGRMTGYVPHSHLSDAGVFIDPKKASTSKLPKKKFKVGQQVKARVLSVDPSKLSLFLTLKPSLLAADIEVLSDYRDAEVGKAYTGVIKYIRDDVIVSFFNNVVACVPRQYVTKDADVVLSEAFHIGQIVNCTILAVDPDAKKMTGSLTTVPFWPAPKREKPEKRKQKPSDKEKSTEPAAKKKKENKNQDVDNTVIEDKKDRKKKKDKQSKLDTEDTKEVQLENKAKKKKIIVSEQNDTETENTQPNKKKRDRKHSENVSEESDTETENVNLKEKAKKKKVSETENTKPNKKKRDRKHSENVSEESDAIETDIYDSDQILTPTEQGLVELSDCLTAKQFKKRVLSLIKAIKAKTARMDRIDKKIVALEEKGLCAQNKKYHTAMHMEKLVIEQRIEKLMEALNTAQGKLKEFDGGEKEYIKKKDLKKQRKESETNSEEDKKTVLKDKKEKLAIKDSKEKMVKESRKAKLKEIKVLENLEPALEVPSAKDFWAATADDQTKNDQDEESSSSDDEEQDQPKKKRKKLTVAEKLAKVREEEERVREMERRAVQAESQPRSSDQFERALLANPDCSQLWIAYMAFHLQATEIEKARAVGRKALNTINFREEDERLNVWLALLNCEHRFGTKESQQKTLEEALQMNDTYKVHSKLLDILVETSKQQELSSLVDLMLRKYKRDPQNYIACGAACFKAGLVDKARHVMQKAVAVLEKKEHVSVLVQFALMERRSGAGERAEALFEQVLAVYPQRADVCAVYVDMLRQSGDRERLRQVMERMTSQKLPARKMKVLYKKWIEAEEKLGDTEQVEKIRQRAMEFIDKAQF